MWSPLCKWYKTTTEGETNWKNNVLYDYPQRISFDGNIEYGGAKWCISMNHTTKHWNDYTRNFKKFFIFALGKESAQYKKIAIVIQLRSDNIFINAVDNEATSQKIKISNLFTETDKEIGIYDSKDAEEIVSFIISSDAIIFDGIESFKKDISSYKANIPTIKFQFLNEDLTFIKVGTRPEGDVYISKFPGVYYYIPYCLKGNLRFPSNRWDKSVLRQWLNSDKPNGQWFNYEDFNSLTEQDKQLNTYIVNYFKKTDGFLYLLGIDKTQLKPVKNKTYGYNSDTQQIECIETEDYVWIPSLTELSTRSQYQEGKPLEYFKTTLGENASPIEEVTDRISFVSYENDHIPYFTRTINDSSKSLKEISPFGSCFSIKVQEFTSGICVLLCFANSTN